MAYVYANLSAGSQAPHSYNGSPEQSPRRTSLNLPASVTTRGRPPDELSDTRKLLGLMAYSPNVLRRPPEDLNSLQLPDWQR